MVNTEETSEGTGARGGERVIGRDMGPCGTVFRVVAGVSGLLLLYFRLPWDGDSVAYFGWMALYLALIACAYVAVFGLLRDRLLGAVSPWVPAGLFQAPVLVYPFGLGEGPLHDALAAYTAGSLLLNAAIGYSGLEVAALPTLIWRRRYAIYSPFNAVDLAEESAGRSIAAHSGTGRLVGIGAALVTAFVFTAFWLIDYVAALPFLEASGAGDAMRLPGLLAAVLLVPAVLAAVDARVRGDRFQGVSALILALLTPMFAVNMIPEVLWIAVIAGGLGVGLVTGVHALIRRYGRG